MKRIVQILLIACLILIGSTSVLAKSSDNQNSITKRIEAAKLVRINWIKAFHYEPIVTLEGPNKTTLVLESVQLTQMQWMRVLWEGTNKELKALGFKKVIFVQQRYNAREFQGWVHDIDDWERTLEKERADKIVVCPDRPGEETVRCVKSKKYTAGVDQHTVFTNSFVKSGNIVSFKGGLYTPIGDFSSQIEFNCSNASGRMKWQYENSEWTAWEALKGKPLKRVADLCK